MSAATYDAAMAVGADGQRHGAVQQVYGWLAFEPGGYVARWSSSRGDLH